jgi:hypothetical protein
MRYYAFKLSSGGFYSSGYRVGQGLHMADILPEVDMIKIVEKSMFIKENIDPDFKLTEIIVKE